MAEEHRLGLLKPGCKNTIRRHVPDCIPLSHLVYNKLENSARRLYPYFARVKFPSDQLGILLVGQRQHGKHELLQRPRLNRIKFFGTLLHVLPRNCVRDSQQASY